MKEKYCHGVGMLVSDIDETFAEMMGGCSYTDECNPDDCVFCEIEEEGGGKQ